MNNDELIELIARSLAPEQRDPPPGGVDALRDAIDEAVSRRRRTGDVKRWLLPAAALALVVAGSVALVATRGSGPTRFEPTSTPVTITIAPAAIGVAAAIADLNMAIADGDVEGVRENVRRVLLAYAALPADDKESVEAGVVHVLGRANAILAPATTTTSLTSPTVPAPPANASVVSTTASAPPTSHVADSNNDDGEQSDDGSQGPGGGDDQPNEDQPDPDPDQSDQDQPDANQVGESSDGEGDGSGSGDSGQSGSG